MIRRARTDRGEKAQGVIDEAPGGVEAGVTGTRERDGEGGRCGLKFDGRMWPRAMGMRGCCGEIRFEHRARF